MIRYRLFESKLWLLAFPYNPIKFLCFTQYVQWEESNNCLCELSDAISDLIQYISENLQAGLGSKYGGRVAISVIRPPHTPHRSLIHDWTWASPPGQGTYPQCGVSPRAHSSILKPDLFWGLLPNSNFLQCDAVLVYLQHMQGSQHFSSILPQSSCSPVGGEVGIRTPAPWLFARPYLILCRNGICWPPLETDQEMECIKSLI